MTSLDPTQELLAAMASFDLYPNHISWTGKLVRFRDGTESGGKKSGWYVAHPDIPKSAAFGSWKRGVNERWTFKVDGEAVDALSKEELARMQSEWAENQARKEEEKEESYRLAAVQAAQEWGAALAPDPEHPYLKKKGIDNPVGIRQNKDGNLLVPGKDWETNSLCILQRIRPDGQKRFLDGGRSLATRTTIGTGAYEPGCRLYVCEGWATGWTVHEATGAPVIVCFYAMNLAVAVAELRDRYPDSEIVVAADNDYWTSFTRNGEEVRNPGIVMAREAIRGVDNARVAYPRFARQHHKRKPTDFNDLYLLESMEEVALHLGMPDCGDDKTHAIELPTADRDPAPPIPEPDPEPEPEDDSAPHQLTDDASWQALAPFRVVGYDSGSYFYLPRGTGQLHCFTATAHRKENLMTLASVGWWERFFPGRSSGPNWLVAADALFRAAEARGVFHPEDIRGRGCWRSESAHGDQQIVIHLGDRLLPPDAKTFVDPETYEDMEGRIYERQKSMPGPSRKRGLNRGEATEILSLCEDLLWYDQASGQLLAGWIALAPLCGWLTWRPHVWIIGDAGSGKTTVLERLVIPLVAGMARVFEGSTTEAGMRQRLGSDALPVIYDEAEQDTAADSRVQSILSLARSASSSASAEVAKGGVHGNAQAFHVRSAFCLSSIGGAIRQEADKTRISVLQLKGKAAVPADERTAHWRGYAPRLAQVDRELGRSLLSRTLGWARDGRLDETITIMRGRAAAMLGDARSGDQYGSLMAGAWTLQSDHVPTAIEADSWLQSQDLKTYTHEQTPAARRVLDVLLQTEVRVDTRHGVRTFALGQLVDAVWGELSPTADIGGEVAREQLKKLGVRVFRDERGNHMVGFANSSEWLNKALRGTPYSDNWPRVLKSLDGVEAPSTPDRYYSGLVSRTTAVPRFLLHG